MGEKTPRCPFLYTRDENGDLVFETPILLEQEGRLNDNISTRMLNTLSNKFVLIDLGEETAHIDLIYLIAQTSDGAFRRLSVLNRPELMAIDGAYLNLPINSKIDLEFEPLPEDTIRLFIVVKGYYIRQGGKE